MGCKQANGIPPNSHEKSGSLGKSRPAPVVVITAPPIPAYVKSVLKKTHQNGKGKGKKLLSLKREPPPVSKSVNFDEQVQVKNRTPTPSKIWYEKSSTTMPMRKHVRDDDDENEDDDNSSLSSAEELNDETMETESPYTTSALPQRSSSFWAKNNSVGMIPTTNSTKENTPPLLPAQHSPLRQPSYSTGNLSPPPIHRIKVRRKAPYSLLPDSPPPVTYSPQTIQVKRQLPNTNTQVIEHRTLSMPNVVSNSQPTAYYAFSRRPIENVTTD